LKAQFCQWFPKERKTRIKNMALFITGLYLSENPHLSKIVRKWPTAGKLLSLTNRLWRFLNARADSSALGISIGLSCFFLMGFPFFF
jgi:hypothetical protein